MAGMGTRRLPRLRPTLWTSLVNYHILIFSFLNNKKRRKITYGELHPYKFPAQGIPANINGEFCRMENEVGGRSGDKKTSPSMDTLVNCHINSHF